RRGDGAAVHRRLLPDGPRALSVAGRSSGADEGLRILRQDGREDHAVWDRHRHRLLHELASLGHARAVLREDPRHPRAHRQQPLRRRVQLRRHAVRGCRAEHAALRARGHAGVEEARRREAGGRARAGSGTHRRARRRGAARLMTTTPLSVYLPFNMDCLRGAFVPAKRGTKPPTERGNWLIIQDQKLLVVPDGDTFRLPSGVRPAKLDGALAEAIWLGTLGGNTECWVSSLPRDAVVPDEFQRETLVPMAGTRLPDDLLSLGGMAMQALCWA